MQYEFELGSRSSVRISKPGTWASVLASRSRDRGRIAGWSAHGRLVLGAVQSRRNWSFRVGRLVCVRKYLQSSSALPVVHGHLGGNDSAVLYRLVLHTWILKAKRASSASVIIREDVLVDPADHDCLLSHHRGARAVAT